VKHPVGSIAAMITALAVVWPCQSAAIDNAGPSYSSDVLPILAANCFACHGFDPHARQAGLRLDEPVAAAALLESGHAAIVPGNVAASGLVARIATFGF
jgi:Planctomycete cytochrome C